MRKKLSSGRYWPSALVLNALQLALFTNAATTSPFYSYSLVTNDGGHKLYSTQPNTKSILTSRLNPIKRSENDPPSVQSNIQYPQLSPYQARSIPIPSSVQANTVPNSNVESLLADQNYSAYLENDLLQQSPLLSNYYLNSPPYYSMESASTNYAFPPAAGLDQYSNYYSVPQSIENRNKPNRTSSLGRRIGELVSNSAEKASRAFKSFSQFKLFNEMKPSRLLGLSNEQQQQQSNSLKTLNSSGFPAPTNSQSWYFPSASMNTWSSFAPPPSSVFYQQPVFVRTQETASNSIQSPAQASINSFSPMLNPAGIAPNSPTTNILGGSKNSPDYLGNMSDFYNPKNLLDRPPGYNSMMNSVPGSQYPATRNSLPASTTTVYHHFQNSNSGQGGAGNGPQDLFAAPQTQFGLRVKAPKEFVDFDSSAEDEMSAEHDDTKMANEGSSNNNDDDDRMGNNNDNAPNNDNGPNGNGGWNGGSSFEDFPDSGNSLGPDNYNQNPHFHGPYYGSRYNRPYNTGSMHDHNRRPPNHRSRHPIHPGGNRKPMSMSDLEDSENWYNTFFGSNVKPITRLRSFPFNNAQVSFPAHPSALMSPSASTQTTTALPPELMSSFLGNQMRHQEHYPHAYMPYSSSPRQTWSYGLFGHPVAASSYYNTFRPNPMMSAATTMRPIAISPYYSAANNYYNMQRYRVNPMLGAYGFHANGQSLPAHAMMGVQPYSINRYHTMPYSPMMSAASSLYPVRIPYTPLASMPFGMTGSIMPAITQPSIMRYRYGPDMTGAIRRSINITKRAEVVPDTSEPSERIPTNISASKTKAVKEGHNEVSKQFTSKSQANLYYNSNRENNDIATMYNAYQVLQKRMENSEPKMEPNHRKHYYYYLSRDNSTDKDTPASNHTESLDGLSSNHTTTLYRSLKARHIDKRDHLKTQHEIRNYLSESQKVAQQLDGAQANRTTETRQAKAIKHEAIKTRSPNNSEWKPLVKLSNLYTNKAKL